MRMMLENYFITVILVWEFLPTLIFYKHDLSDLAPGGLVQSDVKWYPTSRKLLFGKITQIYGDSWITVKYGKLWWFMAFYIFNIFFVFYHDLSCFIAFYQWICPKMTGNSPKRRKMTMKVNESPRNFTKVSIHFQWTGKVQKSQTTSPIKEV